VPPVNNLPHRRVLSGGGLPASRGALVREWLTRTFSGRAVLGGLVTKSVAFLLAAIFGPSRGFEAIDTVGDLAVIIGALVLGFQLFVDLKFRLLWRVRRKLTVSYIFIGFIPALLIIVFFLVAGLLLFMNISAYLMRGQLAQIVEQAQFVAQSGAASVPRAIELGAVRDLFEARVATLTPRYPGASIVLATSPRTCGQPLPLQVEQLATGPWAHTAPPRTVPGWIACDGYAGVTTYRNGDREYATVRAASWIGGTNQVVIVDVPIDESIARVVRDRLGARLEGISAYVTADDARPIAADLPGAGSGPDAEGGQAWLAPFDFQDWEKGGTQALVLSFRMRVQEIYQQIAIGSQIGFAEGVTVGQGFVLVLAVVGVLFLIIQAVAFSMGLALARSITGSVHELAEGTERVRRGDFAGRVSIKSRDQLGELAHSFNSMTASIEDLLQQKAEKERLEQELRIARSIQMSLLPQGPLSIPGISLTAHCEPAREVGGDYYDFLPIDEHTLGILVADVSGKGTSAALYMAELKGIMLSLSQRHRSPRDLLIEADRIISRHLDSRSFITITYLVVDLRAGTLKYSRAGHCPMVYVPGPYAAERSAQLMTPDGMVLGLQLDQGRTFKRLLDEVTVPLGRDDLFVLYTDGLTEAMNSEGDCFGDTRLADLIARHADLPADQLRERILREIDAFTGSALQQDDMTMVLLRVEEVGHPVGTPIVAHADA
jgi:serine phosphatase RsbU (regulator of sigma subunit)